MIAKISLFFLYLVVWLLFSWPPSERDLVIGIFVSVLVTFMTADMPVGKSRSVKSPASFLWLIYYVIVFVWECIKANLDVAYRVIHPMLPIRPATVKVKTILKSDIGLTILANSVTLMPGTTSVDVDRDNGILYVHRLYVRDEADARKKPPVVAKFEDIIKRIFE